MLLEENTAEGDGRLGLHFMDEIGVKSLAGHFLHQSVDVLVFRIVLRKMTDGPFQFGSQANLRGVAGKLKYRKPRQIAEIRTSYTSRPIRIVVRCLMSIDFQ